MVARWQNGEKSDYSFVDVDQLLMYDFDEWLIQVCYALLCNVMSCTVFMM